jgi:hypothetical protein
MYSHIWERADRNLFGKNLENTELDVPVCGYKMKGYAFNLKAAQIVGCHTCSIPRLLPSLIVGSYLKHFRSSLEGFYHRASESQIRYWYLPVYLPR